MGDKVEDVVRDVVITAVSLYFTGGASMTWATAFKGASALTALSYAGGAYDGVDAPKSLTGEVEGRERNIKLPTQARRTIYGENKVGGTVVFLETSDDDKYLHMVLAIADHEVEFNPSNLYLNDANVGVAGIGFDANGVARYIPFSSDWTLFGQARNDSPFWNSICLLYTSPSPRDLSTSRMPSSA